MTSSDFLELIDELLKVLGDEKYLLITLKILADAASPKMGNLAGYLSLNDGNALHQYNERQKSELRKQIDIFKDIDPFILVADVVSLERQLKDFSERLVDGDSLFNIYREAIDRFKVDYKKFNRDKALAETVGLLQSASTLYASLISHRTMLQIYQRNLRGPLRAIEQGMSRLTVVLESELTFRQFASKASSIENAYETIANLLKVNLADRPLSIVKVESGSGWFDLVGDARVVGILSSLLTVAAYYIYGRFTRDGKISAIPRNVEAAERVLELSNKLAAQGCNMAEADENLKNAVVKIAADLNELLEGESAVRVGGERISVGAAYQRALVESRSQRVLEHLSEPEVGPTSGS